MERFEQSGSLNIDLNNEKETVSTEYLDAKYSVVRNPEKGLDEKERVQEHKHKVLRPKCLRIKRSHFTFFDYQTEWASHPEWHKKSNSEAQNKEGAKSGLGAFYKSLLGFAQKESNGDEEKRRKIIEQFFPSNFTYRASLMYRGHYTLQDYQTEWNSHPEWYGKSASEAHKNEGVESGLRSFYIALTKFAKKESTDSEGKIDEGKRKEIIEQFFPSRLIYREHYTLQDYQAEWNSHPEWHGKSAREAVSKEGGKSGLGAFYVALLAFAKKESADSEGKIDEEKRRIIVDQFFPSNFTFRASLMYRGHYTLQDYQTEWNRHPEWHGKSTSDAHKNEGVESGLGSFYTALHGFAKKEHLKDVKKRREIIEQFFPSRRIYPEHYTLQDYQAEWNSHPEWHGKSTSEAVNKEGRKSGLKSFYVALLAFSKKGSGGDEEKRKEIIEQFFPLKAGLIYSDRGYVFQYAVETILRIINNTNLMVEKPVTLEGRKHGIRPDLLYEYEQGKKVIVFDIKLQTTTEGIERDKRNYTKIIKEKYPLGGNLIFLCLNGKDVSNEVLHGEQNIQVRYYHVLDFLERLIDNSRNKFLMRLVSGNEEEAIHGIPELSQEKIDKIKEIIERLKVLKGLVSSNTFSTKGESLEEAAKKIHTMRLKLGKSYKVSLEEIMNTDFKELMDF